MKVLVIDAAWAEHARLCRLLKVMARGRTEVPDGPDALLAVMAHRRPGELVLLQAGQCTEARRHICASVLGGLQRLPIAEIRYFQAEHKYVWVRTVEHRLLIRASLQSLAGEYPGRFVRIHRNALVAIHYLSGLYRLGDGRYRVRLAGIEETLAVSRRRLAAVRRLIREGEGNLDYRDTASTTGK